MLQVSLLAPDCELSDASYTFFAGYGLQDEEGLDQDDGQWASQLFALAQTVLRP